MWVEVTNWVIHGVHSSEKAYLTSSERCGKTQSYLSERFMNISNLRKNIPRLFLYISLIVSTSQSIRNLTLITHANKEYMIIVRIIPMMERLNPR